MTSLPHLLKVPSFDSTLGAVLLGVVIGSMLYGLTVHQTYRYFKLNPEDRLFLKMLVLTILLFESVHTAVWIIVIYHYAVTDAFDVDGALRGHWSVRSTFLVTALAVFVCQFFYARRVFYIGPRFRWLALPAVVSMLTGLSFALAAGIEAFELATAIVDLQRISWLVSVAYGFAVSTDVILTGALVFALHKYRVGDKQTKRMDTLLDTCILYTINTGLLTSVVSVIAFVFALILPGNLIYAAVSIVGTKLYANSVLTLLNSRRSIDNKYLGDFTTVSLPRPPSAPRGPCTADLEFALYPRSSKASTGNVEGMTFAVPVISEGEAGIGV